MRELVDPRLRWSGDAGWWWRFLFCCGAGVFAVRAFFIAHFGASVPLVHEWEATGIDTLGEWYRGTYTLTALLEPHNGDHPTVATRLWEILWYTLSGGWDPKLVMFTKAGVFAMAAAIFVHVMTSALPRRRYFAACLLTVLFAFPFNWHNLLWAVASQFDFLFLAAAAGWLALVSGAPLAALTFGFAALFTNGAGPLVSLSFVPFLVWAMRYHWLSLRRGALLVAAALTIGAFGVSQRTSNAMPHPGTHGDKVATVAQLYAWPFSDALAVVQRAPELARFAPGVIRDAARGDAGWLRRMSDWLREQRAVVTTVNAIFAATLAAPLLLIVVAVMRQRIRFSISAGMLGVGGFAFLMIVATAIARANQTLVAVRFLDHVVLAGMSAIVAAIILTNERSSRVLARGWGALFVIGYVGAIVSTLIQFNRGYPTKVLAVMRDYFAARDRTVLLKDNAYQSLFFEEGPEQVFALLESPTLQPVLPRSLVSPAEASSWLAQFAQSVGEAGLILAFLASAGAAWCVHGSRRGRVRASAPVPAAEA